MRRGKQYHAAASGDKLVQGRLLRCAQPCEVAEYEHIYSGEGTGVEVGKETGADFYDWIGKGRCSECPAHIVRIFGPLPHQQHGNGGGQVEREVAAVVEREPVVCERNVPTQPSGPSRRKAERDLGRTWCSRLHALAAYALAIDKKV